MKTARIIFTSTLLMLVLTTSDSLAGPNRWTSSGPEGPAVTQIVTDPADPATAYVATYAGVFKTSNGGQQWHAVNDGLSVNSLSALLVVPDDPMTLYAAAGSAIFISTDAAQHWSARGRIDGVFVTSFAVDTALRILYAIASGFILPMDVRHSLSQFLPRAWDFFQNIRVATPPDFVRTRSFVQILES